MADKHFLSNTEAAKLLANAERDKIKVEIDPVKGYIDRWPTPEHYAQMLEAVEADAQEVVLAISYQPKTFSIKYYEGFKDTGEFFIGPKDFTFVPCGVFFVDRMRSRVENDLVVKESDADRLS